MSSLEELRAEELAAAQRLAEVRQAIVDATPKPPTPGWIAFLLERIPGLRAYSDFQGVIRGVVFPGQFGSGTVQSYAGPLGCSLSLAGAGAERLRQLQALVELEEARLRGEIEDEVVR